MIVVVEDERQHRGADQQGEGEHQPHLVDLREGAADGQADVPQPARAEDDGASAEQQQRRAAAPASSSRHTKAVTSERC